MHNLAKIATNGAMLCAMLYNAWIMFRVVDDWFGILAAVASLVLFPIAQIFVFVGMFIVPSDAAGPLAMVPGFIVIGICLNLRRRIRT